MRLGHRVQNTLRTLESVIISQMLRARGVQIDEDVVFGGLPRINNVYLGKVIIGARSQLMSTANSTVLGVTRPVIIRLLSKNASIHIGEDVGISGTVICSAIQISIGARCLLGSETMIVDTDCHPLRPIERRYSRPDWASISEPITIEDDVFLGARSMVLKGVRIGRGSVIGAGSVVSRDIPPGVIAAGAPARVIGEI